MQLNVVFASVNGVRGALCLVASVSPTCSRDARETINSSPSVALPHGDGCVCHCSSCFLSPASRLGFLSVGFWK
uniref:Uncharacterized protein n=1 Tax=Populus trichocarpa TaxID=3694 RepID=A0A2K1ZBF8_POPTR